MLRVDISGGVTELPNRNPGLVPYLLPAFSIVIGIDVLLIAVAAYALAHPSAFGGSLIVEGLIGLGSVWTIFTLAIVLAGYRRYRVATPDAVRIDENGIVGLYEHHLLGRPAGTSLTIPFAGISDCLDAGGGPTVKSGYTPARVRGDNIGVEGFDPKSVGELIHGPPTPTGEARFFYVSQDNLEHIRRAWGAWQSHRGDASQFPSSGRAR